MTTLYNAVSTIDHNGTSATRITKFTDGEVESSYLTTHETCECPAGTRPTCRHRQMLPAFQNMHLINTPWFIDWDRIDNPLGPALVCDFQGYAVPEHLRQPAPEGAPAEPGFDAEMQAALRSDAEKLTQLTGEEHTIEFINEPTTQPAPFRRRI